MKDESFQKLIPLIYEASTDAEAWTDASDRLSELFGSVGIKLVDQPMSPSGQRFCAIARFDETLRDRYFQEFTTPETNLGVAAILDAPLWVPFDMLSYTDRTTFDDDLATKVLLRPQDFDKAMLVAIDRNEDFLSVLAVMRYVRQPDFDETDLQMLGELTHHIRRSHKFRRALYARASEQIAAKQRAARSHVAHGLVILNMRGTVLEADAGAEAIFEEANGLKLRNGKLSIEAVSPSLNSNDLQAFVQTPAQHAEPLVIRVRNGVTIVLEHLPVPVGDGRVTERLRHFVSIKRIRTNITPEAVVLSKAYGLTRAEARVADALTYSDNASEAARALGISRETMKSHLNKIYGKTGANSLPQLMLLLGMLS